MSSAKESHEERTAREPRERSLHAVVLAEVTPVGSLVRLLRLRIPDGDPDIDFLPGQWVDTFCPGIAKAGGFTITSAPSKARAAAQEDGRPNHHHRYIELAVKQSPDNPAAAWLWQDPPAVLLGQTVRVRVGGSFVFPPANAPAGSPIDPSARYVFVAGGVGINPLISMVSHLGDQNEDARRRGEGESGPEVVFLYSVRADEARHGAAGDTGTDADIDADRILFLPRLAALFGGAVRGRLQVFLTGDRSRAGGSSVLPCAGMDVACARRRMTTADLDAAVGSRQKGGPRKDSVYVYVCGVPAMTDAFVAYLTAPPRETVDGSGGLGLSANQVLFERWW